MSQGSFHSAAPLAVTATSGTLQNGGRDSKPSKETKQCVFGYICEASYDSQSPRSQNMPGATSALGGRLTPEGDIDTPSPHGNAGAIGISPYPIFFEPKENAVTGGLICGLQDESRHIGLKNMLASLLGENGNGGEGMSTNFSRSTTGILCYTAEYGSLKFAETLSSLQRDGHISQKPRLIVLAPDVDKARSLHAKRELDGVDLQVLPLRIHWEDIELEHVWHICGEQDSSIVIPGNQWSSQTRDHRADPSAIRTLLQLIDLEEPRLSSEAACIQNLCTMLSATPPDIHGSHHTNLARPTEWLRWVVAGESETSHQVSHAHDKLSYGHKDVPSNMFLCIDFADYLPGQEKVVNVLADVILKAWLRHQRSDPQNFAQQLIVCDKPGLYLSPGPFHRTLVQLLSLSSTCASQSPPHTTRTHAISTNIVISTKSPGVISSELLDHLCYLLIHRFTAPRWLQKLREHFWLPETTMTSIMKLTKKETLLFVPSLAEIPFRTHNRPLLIPGLLRVRMHAMEGAQSLMDRRNNENDANPSETIYQSNVVQTIGYPTSERLANAPPHHHAFGTNGIPQPTISTPTKQSGFISPMDKNSIVSSSYQARNTLPQPGSPTITGSASLGGEQFSDGYRRSAFAGVIGKEAGTIGSSVHIVPTGNPMTSPFLSSSVPRGLARSPMRPTLASPGIVSPTSATIPGPFSPFRPSPNLGGQLAISPRPQWFDYATSHNLHAPTSNSLDFRVPSEEQSSNGRESHDDSSFDCLEGGTSGGESNWTKFSTSSVSLSKPSSNSPRVFESSLHANNTSERSEIGSYGFAGLSLKSRSYAGVVAPNSSKSAPILGHNTEGRSVREERSLHDSIGSNSTISHANGDHTYTPITSQDVSSDEPPPPPTYPVSFFWPLLDALEKARAQVSTPHNRAQSVRHSVVGQELPPSARARLGLTFKEYVAAASRAGVIVTGDSGDKAWIAMKDWKYPGKNTGSGHAMPSVSVVGGVRIASK